MVIEKIICIDISLFKRGNITYLVTNNKSTALKYEFADVKILSEDTEYKTNIKYYYFAKQL